MKAKRFTLIEILVVISIIAVLMGLLVPALNKALKRAKRSQALAAVKSMHLAIKQYETTYGFLPFTGLNADTLVSSTQYSLLVNTLGALDTASNPRKLKFLSLDKNNKFLDPWQRDLQVSLDLDYDGDINDDKVYGFGLLQTNVIVWSKGFDGLDSATDTDPSNSDNINSWDR